MQTIIVGIVVVLAVGYLARTLFGKKQAEDACGCGCTGCAAGSTCAGNARNSVDIQPATGDKSD